MQSSSLLKAGILTLVIVLLSTTSWEIYLRSGGISISYDNGKELWADKRAKVYEPADKATVFIGSSRNKYDLDIPTWQSLTGEHAIQLAVEGASPLPILNDLAKDPKFKGKLMIDVTEELFFALWSPNAVWVKDDLDYYKKITPAQRFSFKINHVLESQLVFLDKDYLSLNALLEKTGIPKRPGVYGGPDFPMDFQRTNFDRQNKMTARFVADTNLQNKVKGIWAYMGKRLTSTLLREFQLDSILATVKSNIDEIKARGGQVLFVRTPSSGPFLAGEKMGFPREKFWERILAVTGCPGIHFEDYPAIAHFDCPEFSHLKPADAIIFTQNLVQILQKEKGWTFPHAPKNP